MEEELAKEPVISKKSFARLPFQARLLFVMIIVAQELDVQCLVFGTPHALRLQAKNKIKEAKEAEI